MKFAVTVQLIVDAGSDEDARAVASGALAERLPVCSKCGYVAPSFNSFHSFSLVYCEQLKERTMT